MNKDLRIGRKFLCLVIALVMVMTLIPRLPASFAYAEAGDVPAHDKILGVNEDGTYTIALNVTGDSEKQIQKVNVIVIVDRSGSMNDDAGTGTYEPTDSTSNGLYGLVDGEYVQLSRFGGPGNRTFWYQVNGEWVQYTGQRYYYDSDGQSRMDATQDAVNGLAEQLLGYNGKDGNPNDTVQMALVSFSSSARTDISSTTSYSTFSTAVNGLNPNGGTNWEAALKQADGVSFGDSDPTYVIFFSDGAPTMYGNNQGSGYEQEPNMENSYNAARDDAQALANKVGTKRFYTIFAYGEDYGATYMTNLTSYSGAPAENNYSASNSAELNAAFAEILEAIEMAGIGAVEMTDGTTSSVETTTGEISNLLTVDESSYKYYRAGGKNDDGSEKYDTDANSITDPDGNTVNVGEEWEDAPEAELVDGAVVWNLKEEGVLENDVTYTVTFDCWPSQTTLDIVADIKNDPSSYDKLDANIKNYIDKNGNLKTNTSASMSYVDTRTGQSGSTTFENPDPVMTQAVEELAITKEWSNAFEDKDKEPITLNVTRDGDNKYTMTLNEDNDWEAKVFISIGILRHTTGTDYEVLEKGHDFTFTEPKDLGYYWEIEVPTVRPMLIDGELTMLILKDEDHNNPEGADEYTIDGKTYYVGSTGEAALTAVNHRRSRLNITKVVDGEDADPEQTFPFTVTVNDSKASEGSADNLDSDYYVWFSVWNEGFVDALVSGAEKEMEDGEWTGYYYAPSGSDVVLNLKAGDGLRFLNLPTGTTYTIVEGTMPDNYTFTSAVLSGGEDEEFSGAKTSTGTIVETEKDYLVTYTNTYSKTDVEITKVWEDNDDQDGKRPTTDEFKSWLKLMAGDEDVTSDNLSKLTVTKGEDEDGNTIYTAKWTGLDRYADDEEIEYSVTETPSDDYTASSTTVNDHGTITNSHTPENTDITVTKVWEDANNQDGVRPDSLELTLNGAPTGTTVPTPTIAKNGNNWTYTWTGLPKYADGEEINYTVTEGTVPTGYTCTTTTVAAGGTITNVHTPEETSVTVTKTWNDASNQDGLRPETLELTLNGLPEGTTAPTPTVEKNGNDWTYTWTGLPKNAAGEEIEYTVTEGTVPTGYTCETTTVAAGGTITNSHTPEVVDVSVEKVWDDADDQDGIRPASIGVTLLADGDEVETVTLTENADKKWTATVSGLPKNADGKEIVYTWTEKLVPDGYTCETPTVAAGGTITNKHTPEQTEATVKKVWEDANDQDGFRPDELTVKLLANGEETGKTVTLSESNNWTATIDELDKYAAGKEISYTWDEGDIEKYTLSKTEKDPSDATITTLTNTHTPEKVEVEVEKVWDDADNQDGIRPESVTIKLLADGEDTEKTVTLNEGNQWKGKFEALDKYANGEEIEYTVEEVEVTGYEADVTGNAEASEAIGYIVTNVHEPEVVTIPVEKVWKDADDQDGYRPESVTISLLADGADTGKTVSLNEANGWKSTLEGADIYKYAVGKEGVPVVYTIKELEVKEYTVAISGTVADGYTVTNSHTPEVVEVSVEKVWDDADDRDGIRPDSVTVTLKADGDDITQEGITATVELNEENNWKYTWEGLNKRAAGKEISYTVEEAPIDNYEAEITGDAENGYTIKNFHLANPVPVTIDPPVKKVVKGNPSKNETFTFQMKAVTEGAPMPEGAKDGVLTMNIVGSGEKEFGVAEITKAGTYVYEITEVNTKAENYKYDTTVYKMTVEVKEVADGTQVKLVKTETVEGGNGQIVFTNTYEEPPVKTGDTTIVVPYIVIGVSALILLLMLLFRTRKNRA